MQKQRNNEDFLPPKVLQHQTDDYDVIKMFLNFTRFLPVVYSYQVSALSDLNQTKKF